MITKQKITRWRHWRVVPLLAGIWLGWIGTRPALAQEAQAKAPVPQVFDAKGFQSALLAEFEAANGRWEQAFAAYMELATRQPLDEHFDRAVSMALKGRSAPNALLGARAWIKALPESLEAQDRLVMILLALDKIDELKQPLAQLLENTPAPQQSQAIDRLSNPLRRSNQRTLARQVAQDVLSAYLSRPATAAAAHRTLAWLDLRDNRLAPSLDHARQLVKLGELNSETGMILVSLVDRKVPAAEALLKDMLAQRHLPHVHLAYVQWLIRQQQYDSALDRLLVLTTLSPELDTAWLVRGGLEFEKNQFDASRASLEKYLQLARNSSDATRSLSQARLMLAQMAMQEKRLDQADNWLAQIDDPAMYWDVQQQRAKLKAERFGMAAALTWIDDLPAASAEDQKKKILLQVQLHKSAQAHQTVVTLLRKALRLQPNDTDLMYELAMAIEKLAQWDEFEQLLRRVIQLKPDSAHAYNALGYSFADRNLRLDEAKALIEKAVKLRPDDAYILDSLAWVEFRLGNTQLALDLLRKAFAQQADPEIAAHLGEVLWTLGQSDQARQIWADSLRLNPDNPVLKTTMDRLNRP